MFLVALVTRSIPVICMFSENVLGTHNKPEVGWFMDIGQKAKNNVADNTKPGFYSNLDNR